MKWFEGSIEDAVTTSKQRKAIFVVFVNGKDDVSSQFESAMDESQISKRLERSDFVAIRLESDGESYRFFKQIYQTVPVPSLFFIGSNGSPMEIVSGIVTSADLSKKIDTVLETAGKAPGASSADLIVAEQSGSMEANVSNVPSPAEESTASASGPTVQADVAADAAKELSDREKLERAKQLIELQRLQKIEKEREEEKKREIERRQLGKDVQAAKQKQHALEIKLAYEERMREKAAETAARERVQRQIAQDKLDRKQKALALQEQAAKMQEQNQPTRVEPGPSPSVANGDIARIQFRLPSGSPHTQKFEAASTLGSLRSYVIGNIELPFEKFAMSTTFPRRDLTADDDDKTLTELELVPTAVILILPVKNGKPTTAVTASENIGFVSRFIMALFAPIFSVYNSLVGYFTGGAAPSPPEGRRDGTNVAAGRAQNNSERFGRSAEPTSGSISRNLFGGTGTTIRSRGNIHRLHTGGSDNDENNTWNGNSTQQM